MLIQKNKSKLNEEIKKIYAALNPIEKRRFHEKKVNSQVYTLLGVFSSTVPPVSMLFILPGLFTRGIASNSPDSIGGIISSYLSSILLISAGLILAVALIWVLLDNYLNKNTVRKSKVIHYLATLQYAYYNNPLSKEAQEYKLLLARIK